MAGPNGAILIDSDSDDNAPNALRQPNLVDLTLDDSDDDEALPTLENSKKAPPSGTQSFATMVSKAVTILSPSSAAARKASEALDLDGSSKAKQSALSIKSSPHSPDIDPSSLEVNSATHSEAHRIQKQAAILPFEKPSANGSSSSTGTKPPLLQRLRHKVQENPSSSHEPTVKYLEELLQSCYDDLKDDVSSSARVLLEEAKTAANTSSLFMDKISPWKSIKGDPPSEQKSKSTKIETIISGKSKSSKSLSVTTTTFQDSEPRVPHYTALTIAKHNFLIADDEVLKFVPHFGHAAASEKAHKRLLKELEASYTIRLTDIEAELASQVSSYLDGWLTQLSDLNLTKKILQRHIIQQQKAHNNPDVSKILLESLGGPLTSSLSWAATNFENAFQTVFELELVDVILPESHIKELVKKLKSPPDPLPLDYAMFSTFADFLCLVCGVGYCQRHGDYNHEPISHLDESGSQVGNTEYEYNYQPLGMNYPHLVRKHEVGKGVHATNSPKLGNLDPCSDHCYLSSDANDIYNPWPRERISTLKEYLGMFTNLRNQSCNISFALNVPCWQTSREIQKCGQRVGPSNRVSPRKIGDGKIKDRPFWYDRDKKTLSSHWEDKTDTHSHEMSTQFDPCTHEGPCTEKNGCTCYASNFLCERMCGCSDACRRRFNGCGCNAHDGICCELDTCVCLQLNRECGPECVPCGALDRINLQNKYNDELFAFGCQNIVLQRGVPKKLLIGESTLQDVGFGAYLAEDARKGDFLGEYIGEVISFDESERRAIVYERKDSSFLFDLNSDWTIDAARQGNKTRFINHASTDQQGRNCVAKILFVNGEHRIKFTALRDIKAGEEILFDYGKKFGDDHFEKKLSAAVKEKGKGKSGAVLTGNDLNALDGLKDRNKSSRQKMAAIRGGKGGSRGRGKARKTAVPKIAGVEERLTVSDGREVADSDEDEEAEDVDEDVEDGVEGGRPKRKIRQPVRYTR